MQNITQSMPIYYTLFVYDLLYLNREAEQTNYDKKKTILNRIKGACSN